MDFKSTPVKELARHLIPLLKRNFLEWQYLKKGIASKSGIKGFGQNEDLIEKIVLSEPLATFYACWLKADNNKESDRKLREKIESYIKGLYNAIPGNRCSIEKTYEKCIFIANIDREITPKMIESALALQELTGKENTSLQNIFENEKAFKIIVKSSLSAIKWRLTITVFVSWLAQSEILEKDLSMFYRFSRLVVEKREKELFS